MKNEIRRDYLIDRWVIFAPQRAKRPSDFAVSRSRAEPKVCVFCPGHENLTPPAKLLYVLQGGRVLRFRDVGSKRRSDWLIRCIPNLYPALSWPKSGSVSGEAQGRFPYVRLQAKGVHEILIESPAHDDHPHRASQKQIELWLQAAVDRVNELDRTGHTASIALFRNHGQEAGASIAHAHSQIMTPPLVPARIEQEQRAMRKFQDETSDCALCRIRAAESKSDRKILNVRNFTVFSPWASIFPFEFWIVPKRHSSTIVGLSQEEVKDLARTIRLSFRALVSVLSDPPYNLMFHMTASKPRDSTFHWHIEVYPKLSVHAGFELGTGMYINTLKPEAAAHALTSAMKE